MASSSELNLLSSETDKERLFAAAAEVTHNSEEHFLKNVERKGRRSPGKRFTTLKVSTIKDPHGSEKRIVNEASSKEYASNEIKKATQEHEYVVPMSIYQFAALNPKGCLLNNRGQFSTTGQVLVVVLSFVLIQLWKQGYTDITSISIVVGNVLENRQDRMNGLEEDIHLQFWPFRGQNSHYGLGELQNNQARSDAFFSEGCGLIIRLLQNIGVSVTFLTGKATFAARANGVILPLKDQKTQKSKVYRFGHVSNKRSNGRDSTQAFSSALLTSVGARKPSHFQGLNYWHSDTESASQSFSPTITVTAFPLQDDTPFTYEISSSFLLGSYKETGGGAESKKRMDQRIASARAKREKREKEAREKREKREREAREKRERAEEERRLKREKKEAERQLEKEARRLEEEAIAEAKRVEKEEIEAAKLEFKIDAEKFSDTNDPEIIEALNEARGDLDAIDEELATLDADTEGLKYKENSEKCRELKMVRQKILYRFSELLSVVDENTRRNCSEMEKKRALDRKEERKEKKTSSVLDLLSETRRCA
jgi:hypothetical protein